MPTRTAGGGCQGDGGAACRTGSIFYLPTEPWPAARSAHAGRRLCIGKHYAVEAANRPEIRPRFGMQQYEPERAGARAGHYPAVCQNSTRYCIDYAHRARTRSRSAWVSRRGGPALRHQHRPLTVPHGAQLSRPRSAPSGRRPASGTGAGSPPGRHRGRYGAAPAWPAAARWRRPPAAGTAVQASRAHGNRRAREITAPRPRLSRTTFTTFGIEHLRRCRGADAPPWRSRHRDGRPECSAPSRRSVAGRSAVRRPAH